MTERTVRGIGTGGVRKLHRHPFLRGIWAEFVSPAPVEENEIDLTREEIAALFDMAQTPTERGIRLEVLVFLWTES